MNLTFTEKMSTNNNNNNYNHIRHTSDPEYLRLATQNSITTNQKKMNNLSINIPNKSSTQNENLSLTPRIRTNNTSASKSQKKEKNVSFNKNNSNTSGNNSSNLKTANDFNNQDVNMTNANYLDTMQSQTSSSGSRKNFFNVNPSYLHYFKEKKKKTTNQNYRIPENKRGKFLTKRQHQKTR